MRTRFLFFALLLPSVALGQSWSEFQALAPPFPCQDGWMGCIQEGTRVQPEPSRDSAGFPVAPDMRVGWFDLAPTSGFSPFVGLSDYPAGPAPRIAKAQEPATVAAGGAEGGDASNDGAADTFLDPEAERARLEAERRRIEEAEKRRAQERAAEEAERARREEERRKREADARAEAARRALEAAKRAATEAERQRLQAEARAAEEARRRAEEKAREAERLRKERERQEAERRAEAERAAAMARKAEEERLRKEAEERRKAEEARRAEEERRRRAEEEARRAAEEARRKAEEEARKAQEEAARRAAEAAAAAKAARDEAERRRLEEERRKAEEERRRAEEEARRKAEEAARKAEEEARRKAEEEEARRRAEEQARIEAERRRIAEEEAAKAEAAKMAAAEAEAGDCSDLVRLEPKAALGKLPAGVVQCLEERLAASTRQTEKSRISRLLMANAFATDRSEWERLMKRHLEEIDQSDPDLCYKYALQLSRKGVGSAYEAIKWADVALENRSVWTGNTYTTNVYRLYKVRTVAAQKIWQHLENKHAANPTDESNEKVKEARNRTKVYAREWYEYAKVAEKDTTDALNLCKSAAGTKKYCEAGL